MQQLLSLSVYAIAFGIAMATAPKPHVLFILVDDLGFAEVGFHRAEFNDTTKEVQTPAIDSLVAEGLRLDHHYVHKFCSPTRCSIQSGRAPVHVNVINADPAVHNPADPVGGFAGMPRNMTGVATVMQRAGYATHFAGKWDVGMATPDHTPAGRGYQSSLSYFHHSEDYWTRKMGSCKTPSPPSPPPLSNKCLKALQATCPRDSSPSACRECCKQHNGELKQVCEPESPRKFNEYCNVTSSPVADQFPDFQDGGGKNDVWDLWYYDEEAGTPYPGQPGKDFLNSDTCTDGHQHSTDPGFKCVYADALFEERVHTVIEHHDASKPLFFFWATHVVHGPLQVPDQQLHKFSKFIDVESRARYHAMVNYIDGAIGRVVDQLKSKGMYNNTLIVFTADNGGPLPSGNNWPLKGGKFSNWEGGIRTAAFVSGGFLPPEMRGTVSDGLIGGQDWYATFAGLAGEDPTDHRAEAAGLPPIDSLDAWPLLSGANATSARAQFVIGSNVGGWSHGRTSANTTVGGLIVPPYKILVGYGDNNTINMAGWPGKVSPNSTTKTPPFATETMSCGRTPANGCLFDVYTDPGEHTNLAASHPDIHARLLAELDRQQKHVFSPYRGDDKHGLACAQVKANGNFWGPFLP